MIAAQTGKAFWYATRGTGMVAILLLTVSVVLGIVTSVRVESEAWPRYVIGLVHRNVSLLVTLFIALHVATTVQDGYVPIHYLDALIPFRSSYRTLWLGLGAVAFDLFLAVIATSLLRARLRYRTWRFVHWFAYACWPVAFVHALGTGTDARYGWSELFDAVLLAAVVAAVAWRVMVARDRVRGAGWTAIVSAPVAVVAIIVWAVGGPLRPGWAHTTRRVIPVAATSTTAPTTPSAATRSAAERSAAAGFRGELRAVRRLGSTGTDGRRTISIFGTIHSTPRLALDIELHGIASGPGLVLERGDVSIGPAGATGRWTGQVTSLVGTRVTATVADHGGGRLDVVMRLHIDRSIGSVTGIVEGVPRHAQ